MVGSKFENFVYSILLICFHNNQRCPKKFSLVSNALTKRFGILFTADKNVIPEGLKQQLEDAKQFGNPSSTKLLAETKVFWWSMVQKVNENQCSICTVTINSGSSLKYQSPSTEKNILYRS